MGVFVAKGGAELNPSWLQISPSLLAMAAAGAVATGIAIWWWVRKREIRVRLPIVRILELDRQVLPRLKLSPPPWLPFTCFVLSALALLLFAFRPVERVYSDRDPRRPKVHIVVDTSASIDAVGGVADAAAMLAKSWQVISKGSELSMSFSTEGVVRQAATAEDAAQQLNVYGIRPWGANLGDGIMRFLQSGADIDRIVVIGDRDDYAWSGLNWQGMKDEVRIERIELRREGPASNVFINRAEQVVSPGSTTADFDVEFMSNGVEPAAGEISGEIGGKVLWKGQWSLSVERPRSTVRLSAAQSDVDAAERARPVTALGSANNGGGSAGLFVTWRITPAAADALQTDNIFRSPIINSRSKVQIISDPGGERAIEDPSEQLALTLSVLGLASQRHDVAPVRLLAHDKTEGQDGGSMGRSGLAMIVAPQQPDAPLESFCPTLATPESQSRQGRLDGKTSSKGESGLSTAAALPASLPWIWLIPRYGKVGFRPLCRCLGQLLGDEAASRYCAGVNARTEWQGLLPSIGGKQVGGQLGAKEEALAFAFLRPERGIRVLAFTTPLYPSADTGISHASFPLLLRQLLQYAEIPTGRDALADAASSGQWPRVANIWDVLTSAKARPAAIDLSNVPLNESLLLQAKAADLPPLVDPAATDFAESLSPRSEKEDAQRWLIAIWAICLAMLAVEGLVLMRRRRVRMAGAEGGLATGGGIAGALVIGGLLLFGLSSGEALARVPINTVGYAGKPMVFTSLAKEVSGRTSVQIAPQSLPFATLQSQALREGWLFANGPGFLGDKNGGLPFTVSQWLKRGGFVVVENARDRLALERLVEPLFGSGEKRTHWDPIPPDHEIMRSFYLLDALPQCGKADVSPAAAGKDATGQPPGQQWWGLNYDGRMAMLSIPYSLVEALADDTRSQACGRTSEVERQTRVFVNILLVALTMDYKKDQIHLPEILKRIR